MYGFTGITKNVLAALLLVSLSGCRPAMADFGPRHITVVMNLDATCLTCAKAAADVSNFKRTHPDWTIEIQMVADTAEMRKFTSTTIFDWPRDLEYGFRFEQGDLKRMGITHSLAYIIEYDGKMETVEGYVPLADYIDHLGQ